MSQIDIQKKPSRPAWPWIAGILIIAVAAWLLFFQQDKNESPQQNISEADSLQQQQQDAPQFPMHVINAVNEYVVYVNQPSFEENTAQENEMLSQALMLFGNALVFVNDEVASADAAMMAKRESFHQHIEELQAEVQAGGGGEKLQTTFLEAADLMQKLKDQYFLHVDTDVAPLQATAQQIDAKKNAAARRVLIKQFLKQSAMVLQAFSNGLQHG